MRRGALLSLLACSACAVDDRAVELNAACVEPAPDGTIADFSEARARPCPAGFCDAELVGAQAVSLGEGVLAGIVFPYTSSGLQATDLGVTDTPTTEDAPPNIALWATLESGPATVATTGTSDPDGFTLEFVDCIDAAPYGAVSFEVATNKGSIGTCPLRVAANFKVPGSAMLGKAQPLTAERDAEVLAVTPGTFTLPLGPSKGRSGHSALAGLTWEFGVPRDDPAGCSAYLVIDDIRLVR